MTPRESNTPRRPRRDKYISRACRACQRRKSKCSGHDPCISCQARDLICTYSTEKRRPRRSNLNVQRHAPARRAVSVDKERDYSTRDPRDVELPANNPESVVDEQEPEPSSDQSVHTNLSPKHSSAKTSLYRYIGHDPNRTSLRSQISEARALFKAGGSSESDQQEMYGRGETYPVELPTFAEIEDALHIYFEITATQYPAIDSASTISRIYETLEYLRYPAFGPKVDVDYVAAPTVALLSIVIAISKITGNNTSLSNIDHSITLKNHARNLLQTFEFRPPNLEVLRCHTLVTIYLLHMDFLDLALQSIGITVQIAMTLQLHRQSQSLRKEGDSYDRNLWWTIYILDRSISCLGGTPYLIRDEEIDAPRLGPDGNTQKFSLVTYLNHPSQLDRHNNELEERSFHQDATYLEILAHLGRFWARIWNELFSNNSQPDCQWEATEILDAQIRIFQQRLPPELTWKGSSSVGRDLEKEEEIMMQRQLVLLMRVNTLRLLIRRNPASKCSCLDRKSPHIDGATTSAQTIKAIASMGARHENLMPIGHIVSITLVQCILYLVNVIGESTITSGTDIASSSVVSAYRILIELSARCLSARNAVETLDAAFFRDNDSSTRTHAPPSTIGTLPQCSGSSEQVEREDSHINRLGYTEKRTGAAISTKQTHHPNDLFTCLQRSYETLDSMISNPIPDS